PAARIVLKADRPRVSTAWDDVVFITATVVDEKAVVVPSATAKVKFTVSGPGTIIATDNADNYNVESFPSTERQAFDGQCVAILRASAPAGRITIKAVAEGLVEGAAQVDAAGGK